MKIDDLSKLLEVIEPMQKDEDGKMEATEKFKELCSELIDLTKGPDVLYKVVFEQEVIAIANVVPLDAVQGMRIRKIIENSIHVVMGTLLKGGVISVNDPMEEFVQRVMDHIKEFLGVENIEADDSREEVEENEEELDNKPLTKKEVVH